MFLLCFQFLILVNIIVSPLTKFYQRCLILAETQLPCFLFVGRFLSQIFHRYSTPEKICRTIEKCRSRRSALFNYFPKCLHYSLSNSRHVSNSVGPTRRADGPIAPISLPVCGILGLTFFSQSTTGGTTVLFNFVRNGRRNIKSLKPPEILLLTILYPTMPILAQTDATLNENYEILITSQSLMSLSQQVVKM